MMKSKWYVVILCGIALFLILAGWGIFKLVNFTSKAVKDISDMKVPYSLEQAETKVAQYPGYAEEDVEKVVPGIESENYVDASAYKVQIDGKEVQLAVFKCETDKKSRKLFDLCKNKKRSRFKNVENSINTLHYGYWSSLSNGQKYYLWQRNGWVVFIQSADKDAAEKFKTEFEGSL